MKRLILAAAILLSSGGCLILSPSPPPWYHRLPTWGQKIIDPDFARDKMPPPPYYLNDPRNAKWREKWEDNPKPREPMWRQDGSPAIATDATSS